MRAAGILAHGLAAVLLAGCATPTAQPLEGDAVRTPAQAIALGKRACMPAAEMYLEGDWRAQLRGRRWRVWFDAPMCGAGCPTYEAQIDAADGRASGCTIQVIAS